MVILARAIEAEVAPRGSGSPCRDALFVYFFGSGERRAVLLYRLAEFLYRSGCRRTSRLLFVKLQRDYGCYFSAGASIDLGLKMPHPIGIVIGAGVVVGSNVTIYQNVTLGGARVGDAAANLYPQIGDGTVIFAGAKLLGKIKVGVNCIVGANAVVTRDIPANHVAVGVPARSYPRSTEGDVELQ